MKSWDEFPAIEVKSSTPLWKIHLDIHHPAWFNSDGRWRFDPPPSHRIRFGTCYVGFEPVASYIEVFGRMGTIPQDELDRRALSELRSVRSLKVADLNARSILGDFGLTAAVATGMHYDESQALAAQLFDAGFDAIRHKVRYDPAQTEEGLAVFGEPGEYRGAFRVIKTDEIDVNLIEQGREFRIDVIPSAPLL